MEAGDASRTAQPFLPLRRSSPAPVEEVLRSEPAIGADLLGGAVHRQAALVELAARRRSEDEATRPDAHEERGTRSTPVRRGTRRRRAERSWTALSSRDRGQRLGPRRCLGIGTEEHVGRLAWAASAAVGAVDEVGHGSAASERWASSTTRRRGVHAASRIPSTSDHREQRELGQQGAPTALRRRC